MIATGSSGGHMVPALALADVLRSRGHEVVLAGAFDRLPGMVADLNMPVYHIQASPLQGKSLTTIFKLSASMLQSVQKAGRLIAEQNPAAVIGFGGYAAFAVVMSAALRRLPVMIHEQNVRPGRANRLLMPWVRRIAVSFEETRRFCPRRKCCVTGYPLRRYPRISQEDARRRMGLAEDASTVLVCGGSQGSRAVNRIMTSACNELVKKSPAVQFIHIAGEQDRELVETAYRKSGVRARVYSFCDDMAGAYCAADAVVIRAGAGALHEAVYFDRPAVVIPYPYARGHQMENALALRKRFSGLTVIPEERAAADSVAEALQAALRREKTGEDREDFMRAADRLAAEIERLAEVKHGH
ncbi:MAG: UDP-N-acetylglucosamine--N-acetylmuramyl-(pentapeptide) pyrophosphoryl-undecaprenol N-acetylglucosamine transferase [Candidatus Omnitrophota bacterium]